MHRDKLGMQKRKRKQEEKTIDALNRKVKKIKVMIIKGKNEKIIQGKKVIQEKRKLI